MPETLIIPCPVDALVYRNRDVLDANFKEAEGRRQKERGEKLWAR